MASTKSQRRHRRSPHHGSLVHKPNGVIHPRVQVVGPEHFAIIAVDCAKARSKWMMTDFYGKVLVPPTILEHHARGFRQAVTTIQDHIRTGSILDQIVAVERTGKYHHPVKRAFAAAGLEVRIVHPFTTKQFRQPAHPGLKTDDTDLAAIHRAAVNGFGLTDPPLPEEYLQLRTWARHRRDLVRKATVLRCQIGDILHDGFPGYERCFDDIFMNRLALLIPQHLAGPREIAQAGQAGLEQLARRAGVRFQLRAVQRILAWAEQAASGGELPELRQLILRDLELDRSTKARQIARIERELARRLVQTPYVLLLGIPGINVVSAAEVAGELGPIGSYASARQMTGRAGLYPRRYQSDQVDRPDGPLVQSGNRSLRRALLQIAANLVCCNHHFRELSARWLGLKKDKRDIRVRVADRFCRIAFQMVAGWHGYRHPCSQQRHYVIKKLIDFYNEHHVDADEIRCDLDAAVAQLPRSEHAGEAAALTHQWAAIPEKQGTGPRRLREILPALLAKLGGGLVQSPTSGEVTSDVPDPDVEGPDNAV
jgi:transposase